MSLYRAYFVPGGVDPSGLEDILAAIDGTNSRRWLDNPDSFYKNRNPFKGGKAKTTKLKRWFSHVFEFCKDYGSKHKKYFDGPRGGGFNSGAIRNNACRFVCSKFCKLYGDDYYCVFSDPPNIDLIGMSRGAVIANEVAYLLYTKGCTCSEDKRWNPTVRFVGFYDPVNMFATMRDGWDALSPNIGASLNVAAAPFPGDWLSRAGWNRPENYGPTTKS